MAVANSDCTTLSYEYVERVRSELATARFKNRVFEQHSESQWKEYWSTYEKYTKFSDKEENNFKGYDDHAFRQYRKSKDEEVYNRGLKRLEKLKEIEPK